MDRDLTNFKFMRKFSILQFMFLIGGSALLATFVLKHLF